MSGRHDAKEIRAEQGYLDWALDQLDAQIERLEHGPLMGDGAVNRQILASREHKIGELRAARAALLIGRLDVAERSEVAGTWYIGRSDVADERYETVVVDWRSELGARFYEAGRSDPKEVGRRRTFGTRGNQITSIDDELLISGYVLPGDGPQDDRTEPDDSSETEPGPDEPSEPTPEPDTEPVDDGSEQRDGEPSEALREPVDEGEALIEDLRAGDLLLEELERGRTDRMHEIVTTIQGDQDRFIRTDPSQPLVVQGGPGTGKTIVGLHRAAYLLYKQREGALDQSMLIVGPNSAFMDYIGAVLPSLGETSSRQLPVDELMLSALRPADRRGLGATFPVDGDAAARAKGGPAMALVLARAVWSHAQPKAVETAFRGMRAELDEAEVAAMLDRAAHGRAYDDVRGTLVDQLAEALARKVRTEAERLERKLLSRDLEDFTDRARAQLRSQNVRDEILPRVSPAAVLDRVLGSPEFLDEVGRGLLSDGERAAVAADAATGKGKRRERTRADLALLDELAVLIGREVDRFDHVIVDEAQDLSPMQWRAISRRVRGGGITILGDLAQATGTWSPESWRQLLDHLGFEGHGTVGELKLGYRVPRPILDYASRLLAVAAPGVPVPVSYRDGDEPELHRVPEPEVWDAAVALVGRVGGRTAIVAPPDGEVPLAGRLAEGEDLAILSPDEAKGLEFDQVIVLDPATLASEDQRGHRQLYVALTRATKRLDIVHSNDLPEILEGQIPGLGDAGADPSAASAAAWEAPASMTDLVLVAGPVVVAGTGWFPDPTDRFAHRHWDGERWTGWVAAESGAVAADPVPVDSVEAPTGDPSAIEVQGLPVAPS